MKENIIQSFKIMGLGMLAIFVVVAILIVAVSIMSYIDQQGIKRKMKNELSKNSNDNSTND